MEQSRLLRSQIDDLKMVARELRDIVRTKEQTHVAAIVELEIQRRDNEALRLELENQRRENGALRLELERIQRAAKTDNVEREF
ncbi:hypothetical protein A1Q2_04420 [Trichosporon asahii var. asahii CBS 8904]|uniref:Uncharacterized protein n=2 Tax=Trichosporon asahii var. asahii TaxID=189963 RepID=K1VWS4_TRIAC|nr:hypothetical protein A1Q1_03615 [Trichosporon asahii var. asahii CBS 2479]EJT47503.1 hypothetical protein A1Q1_03615 [Trichosporon asahii var. asahii CBS 2479]EKD01263.1 hypothetical protein A1Q2_04420 [Trichosporon asahii var. asahii CBS 8904]